MFRFVTVALVLLVLAAFTGLMGCSAAAQRFAGMGDYLARHSGEGTKADLVRIFGSPTRQEFTEDREEVLTYMFSAMGSASCSCYVIELDRRGAIRNWERAPCGPLEPAVGADPSAPLPVGLEPRENLVP